MCLAPQGDMSPKAKLAIPASMLLAGVSGAAIGLYTSADRRGAKPLPKVRHKTIRVGEVDIFYREAGPEHAPAILLLHGFPMSSRYFRTLMPLLADRYRLVAPDYPGFGHSAMPSSDAFEYTFDQLATVIDRFTEQLGLTRYALYVQDYGAPIGFRLASAHPERITAIVVQNGNAYDEGIAHDFWAPLKAYWADPQSRAKRDALRALLTYEATTFQYVTGARDPELIAPDAADVDQFLLDRPGNAEIQLDLFRSYGSNPPLYPRWQAYFRAHQPPMLIAWGKHDPYFLVAGAEAYKRDLPKLEFHLLDAGHAALETDVETIADLMRDFLSRIL
jgi:pimeloyl-ACP methyl ester carboxylesterase